MASGRDTEVYSIVRAEDRMQAETAVAGLPLVGVLVVADGGDHFPRVAGILTPEKGRGFDAAPQLLVVVSGLKRPDIRKCTPILFRKGRYGFRFLKFLAKVGRKQQFHSEKGIAAGGINAGLIPRIDQGIPIRRLCRLGPPNGRNPGSLTGDSVFMLTAYSTYRSKVWFWEILGQVHAAEKVMVSD